MFTLSQHTHHTHSTCINTTSIPDPTTKLHNDITKPPYTTNITTYTPSYHSPTSHCTSPFNSNHVPSNNNNNTTNSTI